VPLLFLLAGLILLLPVIGLHLRHPFPDRRLAHVSAVFVVAMASLLPAGALFLYRRPLGWLVVGVGLLFNLFVAAFILRRERGLARILAELDNAHLAPEVPRRLKGLLRATHSAGLGQLRYHDEHALYGGSFLLLYGLGEEAQEVFEEVDPETADRDIGMIRRSLLIVCALHEGALEEAQALIARAPSLDHASLESSRALKRYERSLVAPAVALVAATEGRNEEAERWLSGDKSPVPGEVFQAVRELARAHRAAALDRPNEARTLLLALSDKGRALALRIAHATPGPASDIARQIEAGGDAPYR
jgi:hypothetical protein